MADFVAVFLWFCNFLLLFSFTDSIPLCTESNFCKTSGGSKCFDGEKVVLNKCDTQFPSRGLCLEKIGNGSYLNMVAHPDGSDRAFFANQAGKIWLATIPEQGLGGTLGLDESSPFMDLTDQVHFLNSFGLMGLAFHPNFARNGRFFASFNCDRVKTPGCSGKCSCNSDVNCDPLNLASSSSSSSGSVQPCRYYKVIAEFTANGTASDISMATRAKPSEVRRIFSLGLPIAFNHGGQILFGPADGYLYAMLGDGGIEEDSYNFSQNKKSLLGKILRLDVDNMPSESGIVDLWGNYSIPQDNPFSEDNELQPEIWARGLRNPWRCSFDSQRPLYFICADAGQDEYEEVDIITKGGNYGWNVYEGPFLFNSSHSSAIPMNLIFPVLGYKHSDVNNNVSASICGGYFYRSMTDPCLYGSYLYGDLYGSAIWSAVENPTNSGNFTTTLLPFSCAHDSPIQCKYVPESSLPDLRYIYSFGEDNRKEIYVLANNGVYRVVRPSRCNYTCPKEIVTVVSSQISSSSSCRFNHFTYSNGELMLLLSSLLHVLGTIL